MRKAEAMKLAEDAGYTIHWKSDNDVAHYFRKPGVSVNGLNEPDMWAVVKKSGKTWVFQEGMSPRVI